jgi:hypothetical protein
MDRKESWITSKSDDNDCTENGSANDNKKPAAATATSKSAVASTSKNEVIDLADSDNDSHYSC